MQETLKDLDKLKAELFEGWDGEDGLPLNENVYLSVKAFLSQEPSIAPTSDGGLDIEWEWGDSHITMFFKPSGDMEMIFRNEGQHFYRVLRPSHRFWR